MILRNSFLLTACLAMLGCQPVMIYVDTSGSGYQEYRIDHDNHTPVYYQHSTSQRTASHLPQPNWSHIHASQTYGYNSPQARRASNAYVKKRNNRRIIRRVYKRNGRR